MMDGWINVNKPVGITSYDVIRRLKTLTGRRIKLGHLGTLDPLASGVLPVAAGLATKIIPWIDKGVKEYKAVMKLGAVSDTQDSSGQITHTGKTCCDLERLREITDSFLGWSWQTPPMYSALHHKGQRLYELARQGITVMREAREIEITSLEITRVDLKQHDLPEIELNVVCSAGTYIRTLCHDIGEKVGTGGFLNALERTRSGGFKLDDAVELHKLEEGIEKYLYPLDWPLADWPEISVTEPEEERKLINGNSLNLPSHWDKFDKKPVKVYGMNRSLLALANIHRLDGALIAKPVKVFNTNSHL